MMKRTLKQLSLVLIWLLTMFSAESLQAAEDILVRVKPQPENPWVGERVLLQLDVLAKDGWAQLRTVRPAKIDGGFLIRYETQGTRLSETIDDETYTGQRYEYLFFAQRPGKFSMPPLPIEVEVKSWGAGGKAEVARLATPPFQLEVRKPDSLQTADGLISTTDLVIEQKWEPEITELRVGDAITRTITMRARDVSAMVFEPLQHLEVDGISSYPGEPAVDDTYNRGDLVGERVEKITYLFEQGGEFQLPDYSFSWWNTEMEEVSEADIKGKTIKVEGEAMSSASPASGAQSKKSSLGWNIALAVFVLLLAPVLFFRKKVNRWLHQWRQKLKESEQNYFRAVRKAAQSSDRKNMLQESMRWLDRISEGSRPARFDSFLAKYGRPNAQQILSEFMQQGEQERNSAKSRELYQELAAARAEWHRARKRKKRTTSLPAAGMPARK